MSEKWKSWVCIAWKKGSSEIVCKEAVAEDSLTGDQVLAHFKTKFPKLRNHTVNPKIQ